MEFNNLVPFLISVVIFGCSNVFQVYRMWKTKSSRDVSIWFIIMMSVGIIGTFILTLTAGASLWVKWERFISIIYVVGLLTAVLYWRLRK